MCTARTDLAARRPWPGPPGPARCIVSRPVASPAQNKRPGASVPRAAPQRSGSCHENSQLADSRPAYECAAPQRFGFCHGLRAASGTADPRRAGRAVAGPARRFVLDARAARAWSSRGPSGVEIACRCKRGASARRPSEKVLGRFRTGGPGDSACVSPAIRTLRGVVCLAGRSKAISWRARGSENGRGRRRARWYLGGGPGRAMELPGVPQKAVRATGRSGWAECLTPCVLGRENPCADESPRECSPWQTPRRSA